MYKKLEIKNPCTQNWDEMQPMGAGRHCTSCNHIIHDFSKMNNRELLETLQGGKYRCGMFTKDQMGTIYLEKEKTSNRKKYWSTIAASIVAGTLQLTTSYGQTQNPVRKNAPVVDRSTMEKFFENKTETTQEEKTTPREKFSFRIVDSKTKQPLNNVQVEIMGITAHTDSLGRIDFELEYEEGQSASFIVTLYLYKYQEEKIKLNLKTCYRKLNILYMEKKNTNKEYLVLGQWG